MGVLETMMQRLVLVYDSSIRQVTCKQVTQRRYVSWRQVTVEEVLQGAGTQSLRTYGEGDRRQWRSGWPSGLFLTFVREIRVTREGGHSGCHGGGRTQWRIC